MNLLHLFSSPFFKALSWSLLHSLWQAALIYVLMRTTLLILRQAKSSIKYIIAYSSVITIALWFAATLSRLYDQQTMSLPLDSFSAGGFQHGFVRSTPVHTTIIASYMERFFPMLLILYAIGLCILGIKLFHSYIHTIKLKNNSYLRPDDTWQELTEALCDKIGLTKRISLFISETIDVPMTIGTVKAVILLPLAAINSLSPGQMEAVLLHELSHIRRQDYLLNLIQSCIETILFFNPFVLFITGYIKKERENCCDEMVLHHTSPHDYAQALVSLEEARTQKKYRLALTAVNKEPYLFNRIKKIMEMKKNNIVSLRQKLAALVLAAVGLCSIAWISPGTGKEESSPSNKALTANTLPAPYSFIDSVPVPAPPVPKIFPENRTTVPKPPEPPKSVARLPLRQFSDTAPQAVKEKYFESDAWKQQQRSIQNAAEKIEEKIKSPEWKQYQQNIMAGAQKMSKDAEAFSRTFNSSQWKKLQYAMQQQAEKYRQQAREQSLKFNSPQWQKQQESFGRQQAEELQKYFQSKDWKKQQHKIVQQAKKFRLQADQYGKQFSSQWEKHQAAITGQSEKLQQYFQSKDWQDLQQKIQDQSKKLQEYFNSDEWKKAQQNMQDGH